jgi:hypothetical protein
VLIGGTACDLAFTNAGVAFRATSSLRTNYGLK